MTALAAGASCLSLLLTGLIFWNWQSRSSAGITEQAVQTRRARFSTVPPGATLVLYTDGFTEAMNGAEEELGSDRWLSLLREHESLSATELVKTLLARVAAFEAGAPPRDDKTLVIVRRARLGS